MKKYLKNIKSNISKLFKQKVKTNSPIVFTPEIITKYNFGLYIINVKADVVKRPDYAATVSWKLGYHINRTEKPTESTTDTEKRVRLIHNKYVMSNFLTDGWVTPIGNDYEEVCEYLNNNFYGEKFRIMTKDELFYLLNHRTNIKQLFYE